jgi:hypothetical protein
MRLGVLVLAAVTMAAGCSESEFRKATDNLEQAAAEAAVWAAGEAVASSVKSNLADGSLTVEEAAKIMEPYKGLVETRIVDADNDGVVDGGIEIKIADVVLCVVPAGGAAQVDNKSCG